MSTLAILHSSCLLGKELRESLDRRQPGLAWTEVRLLTTRQDEVGTLTEIGGAAAMVQRYEPGSLEGVDAAFFCGPIAENRAVLAELPAGLTAIVLSPDAGPEDGEPVVAGVNAGSARLGAVLLSPHPAAVLLAHLLHPLAELGPREAAATLIQPVSLRDHAGIEELFEQSRQIIAMTQRRKSAVFGAQIAFNLLPLPPAERTSEAITGLLASLLPTAPRTSVQLIQGGIFHGISASLRVRFGDNPGLPALRQALARSPYLETPRDPFHLGPVDAAAASDKVLVAAPRREPDGFWLWAVMDNLTRGGASNALDIAAEVL